MTAQIPEKLIHQRQTFDLCDEPLYHYLKTIRRDLKLKAPNTALWRGYVGTWKIEDGGLYLSDFKGYLSESDGYAEIGLKELFGDYPDGVFAHWVSGELRCPMGGLLRYIHSGYASMYERDLFFGFERGRLVSQRLVENGLADAQSSQGYTLRALVTFGEGGVSAPPGS